MGLSSSSHFRAQLDALHARYRDDLAQRLDALRNSLHQQDRRALESGLHRLAGSAASFGLHRLSELAFSAEARVRSGEDLSFVADELQQLYLAAEEAKRG